MHTPKSPLVDFDLLFFKEELANFKEELLTHEDDHDQKAFYIELIKLLDEEINKRQGKAVSIDIRSDIQFFAYINLFQTLIASDEFDEDFDESDFDDFDFEEESEV